MTPMERAVEAGAGALVDNPYRDISPRQADDLRRQSRAALRAALASLAADPATAGHTVADVADAMRECGDHSGTGEVERG